MELWVILRTGQFFCSSSHLNPSSSHSNLGFLRLWFVSILLHFTSIPPLLCFFSMPRQRGKSKRGFVWYRARGRGSRGCKRQITLDLPQNTGHASTPDLPPLSSPWACRVEWFDSMGNSLSFAPKLSPEVPPLHQPPSRLPSPSTLPSPTASLTSSTSPHSSSASPHTSSSSPHTSSAASPPPSPPLPPSLSPQPQHYCARCNGFMKLQNSLDNIKNSVFEIRHDMAEMLSRDVLKERREEHLETLLCALLHTTLDIGTSATDLAQDPQKDRKSGPSSG